MDLIILCHCSEHAVYLEKVTFSSIMLHKAECKLSLLFFFKKKKGNPLLTSKPHMAYVTSSTLQNPLCLGTWISLAGILFSLQTHSWLGKIRGNWINRVQLPREY